MKQNNKTTEVAPTRDGNLKKIGFATQICKLQICNTTCKTILGNIRISVREGFYIQKAWKVETFGCTIVFVHEDNSFQPNE